MKKLLILAASVVLCSCAATKPATPTESDVERAKAKYPDISLDLLSEGKSNFERQCNKCHGLNKPFTKNAAQLNQIVPKMVVKANKKAGKEVIDPAMQESILRYLVTMTKK